MNKTVSIHLQGFPFIFEEQAYATLESYLNALRNVLQHEEGLEEIIQDVELRIVELLQPQLSAGKQVVENKLVEEIIAKIGQPKDFGSETQGMDEPNSESKTKATRRFFRDSDTALLGGVCSGAAAYFNIDVVFIRAIYLISFLTFGVGGLLYFILWIIIPPAKTSSDKLQMKGQVVNLENMKTELGSATNRLKKEAKALNNRTDIANLLRRISRFVSIIIGVLSMLVGSVLLITTLIFIFIQPQFIPAEINGQQVSLRELLTLIFDKSTMIPLAFWGIGLINLSIIGLCFLIGIRCFKSLSSKIIYIGMGVLLLTFIIGTSMAATAGVQFAKSIESYGEIEKEIATYHGENLTISPILNDTKVSGGYTIKSNGDDLGFLIQKNNILFHGIEIMYEASNDSSFHIYQLNSAQGSSHEKAIYNARQLRNISFLKDSIITINPCFSFPKSTKLRDQKIKFRITVPSNRTVLYQGRRIYPIIDSISTEIRAHGYISKEGDYSEW
jgi:phage shock protein PspC (stress-responsive transcriptional regulator)